MRKTQIGIIGGEEKNLNDEEKKLFFSLAEEIGSLLAKKGVILITGGCSGISEAACQGAINGGGITVGTPGPKRFSSTKNVTVEICTPIDIGDYLFAGILSSDVIIVFPGGAGTLAEIALAYRYRKPLVFIGGISDDIFKKLFGNIEKDYPFYVAKDAFSAVKLSLKAAEEKLNKVRDT